VIENGRNGFIIEAGDVEQTAGTLRELLSPETDLEPLRENARRTVEDNFNMDDYTERLDKLYADVARRNGRT
jgi:glycosyltransferase involved in cell wall biosynthesis